MTISTVAVVNPSPSVDLLAGVRPSGRVPNPLKVGNSASLNLQRLCVAALTTGQCQDFARRAKLGVELQHMMHDRQVRDGLGDVAKRSLPPFVVDHRANRLASLHRAACEGLGLRVLQVPDQLSIAPESVYMSMIALVTSDEWLYRPHLGIGPDQKLLMAALGHSRALVALQALQARPRQSTAVTNDMMQAAQAGVRRSARAVLDAAKGPAHPVLRRLVLSQVCDSKHSLIFDPAYYEGIRDVVEDLALCAPEQAARLLSDIDVGPIIRGTGTQVLADGRYLSGLMNDHPDRELRASGQLELLSADVTQAGMVSGDSLLAYAQDIVAEATADPAAQLPLHGVMNALIVLRPFFPDDAQALPAPVLSTLKRVIHYMAPLPKAEAEKLGRWMKEWGHQHPAVITLIKEIPRQVSDVRDVRHAGVWRARLSGWLHR